MKIAMIVNGERRELDVEARRTLADALREDLNLTGTHLGCEHGVCGSCTVLDGGEAVRSCLMFADQCAGEEVRTVEDLGGGRSQLCRPYRERLHPLGHFVGPTPESSLEARRCGYP